MKIQNNDFESLLKYVNLILKVFQILNGNRNVKLKIKDNT